MEREELENDIVRIKKDLRVYLKIFPMLEVGEKEKDRVVNQMLDDIISRKKKN
ncbi:MAG: hypothetical protein LBL94_09555 [Prevotellaceae bacterium]|jgi:hypothetical protein|nr:hypothetical protein [Prevotellaceae bacterium]